MSKTLMAFRNAAIATLAPTIREVVVPSDCPVWSVHAPQTNLTVTIEDMGGYWFVEFEHPNQISADENFWHQEIPAHAPGLAGLLAALDRDPIVVHHAFIVRHHIGTWVTYGSNDLHLETGRPDTPSLCRYLPFYDVRESTFAPS